ncbi:MAG: hypothetical protein IT559_09380 [Alphaproteobacteria bacterium]|nr:hypothetical protein [Alphaproteobacteria bacterium]
MNLFTNMRALRLEITGPEFKNFALLLLASIAVFFVFKCAGFYTVEKISSAFFLIVLGVAAAGSFLKMSDFVLPSRIVLRTIFGLFGLYVLAAYPTMPDAGLSALDGWLLHYGRFVAAGFAALALLRPSFGLVLLAYIFWFKGQLSAFFIAKLSVTDYMPLIEVAAFIVIAQMIWMVFARLKLYPPEAPRDERILNTGEKIFLCAVAVHMANYFYSAVQKILIGDHPLSWVLENQTQVLTSNALAYGQLPISFSPFLTGLSYDGLALLIVAVNFVLFFGQLFSLIALLRVRWGIWTTLFYDLTHVVIFITSGIFFYKWIILNLSVVMALETLKKRVVSPAIGLLLMCMVVSAPAAFWVAHLGWWDTPQTNIEYFSAITKDGREIKVPSNYFGGFSIAVGQQRLIPDKTEGFLPTTTYGLTRDQHIMEQGLACRLENGAGDVITTVFADPENKIEPFIRAYHQWVLKRAGPDGHWSFDLYPHHIFSFPWDFTAFNTLNLNDIATYRYTIQSACVRMEKGRAVITVTKEGHHDIRLDTP